jgi:hypothetical protein
MANPSRLSDVLSAVSRSAPESQYIRAYHGSPYDFDEFDASKIDTGEGAQAYGHGLYFAGSEDTAKHYKTVRTPELTLGEDRELATAVKRMQELKALTKIIPKSDPRAASLIAEWDQLRDRRAYLENHPGRMYEVEIGYPEGSLLDWDAPISRQPKVVQQVFGEFAMDRPGDGGRIYRDIAARLGEDFDNDMTGLLAGRAAADELLREGIPGIRYLDQRSRRAGEGSRNYVMFPGTEDSIRILRKYGLLAPIAAGAAMGEE